MEQARRLSAALGARLKQELVSAMQTGGPLAAVSVCKERAPALARDVLVGAGKADWTLGRTSARWRNPDNAPTPWQQEGLQALKKRLPQAEPEAAVEWHRIDASSELHYMSAIPMGGLCVTCHGAKESIAPALAARIEQLYPDDRAMGFVVGELRGAFFVAAPPGG